MDPDLADAIDNAWMLLTRGAADRRSPVHTPVVASIAGGAPDARVMVLRHADRAAATLRFHTDARSPKCAALNGGRVAVLAYHPGSAVQLRITGTGRIDRDSAVADAAWARSTPFARRCYLVSGPPGSPLPGAGSGLSPDVEGRKPTEAELVPARANFALLHVDMTGIDWLHLAQGGHRRAIFEAHDAWRGAWVVP